jgi:cytochrome c-type biogenesis protein CcmH/NrfG
MGSRGPETQTNAEVLQARERAVTALPDETTSWVLLGDTYYHWGSVLGFPDWRERAAQAFEQALALDATYIEPLEHVLQLATRGDDTTEIRRLWQRFVQLKPTSANTDILRYSAAVALADEEMRADALRRLAAHDWFVAGFATGRPIPRYAHRHHAQPYPDRGRAQ